MPEPSPEDDPTPPQLVSVDVTPPKAEWQGDSTLALSGDWVTSQLGPLWGRLAGELRARNPHRLVLDAGGIARCDSAGIALILELRRQGTKSGEKKDGADKVGSGAEIRNLRPELQQLLEIFEPSTGQEVRRPRIRHHSAIEQMGAATVRYTQDAHRQVEFIGELAETVFIAILKPRTIRWGETVLVFEKSGVDALPLVCVISFLMGLIMAFQAALPMRDFGADIFVANLVVLSMFRELGVLMTAVVLAGRSGSAFAAEIGTMKVNEELDALQTMGLNPMRFLVLPRVVAGTLVMPLLTVFANISGCAGGFIVMLSLGHTPMAIWQQVLTISPMSDLTTGLIKSFVFGLAVAGVGCLRGLQTAKGPTAVGDSTTSAVVSGIFLVVILDAVFAVLFHILGI